jgi:hypothetical protein
MSETPCRLVGRRLFTDGVTRGVYEDPDVAGTSSTRTPASRSTASGPGRRMCW